MFLLYCDCDNSYCLVENENVVCDEDNIKKDDEVIFTYKNKEYTGKVMEHSDNKCYMEKQLHMLRLEKAKKEKKVKKSESFNKTEVSLRKRNELGPSKIIKSSAKDITKKKNDTKKVLKKIQRTSNAAVFDLLDKYPTSELSDNASNSQKSSPTKEELKEMLYQTRKKLEERSIFEERIEKKERKIEKDFCDLNSSDENNLEINVENPDKNSIKNSVTNIENNLENFEDENEIEELENADIQLYGKDFESKMIHLKNNFYCRNAMFYSAIGNAHRPSQLVRRLLTGVFKKEALINGTLTGQTARAQGRDRQCVKMTCLHPFAINAIVDFSIEHGIKHGWIQQTKKELHRAITQRIVEIKRELKNEL